MPRSAGAEEDVRSPSARDELGDAAAMPELFCHHPHIDLGEIATTSVEGFPALDDTIMCSAAQRSDGSAASSGGSLLAELACAPLAASPCARPPVICTDSHPGSPHGAAHTRSLGRGRHGSVTAISVNPTKDVVEIARKRISTAAEPRAATTELEFALRATAVAAEDPSFWRNVVAVLHVEMDAAAAEVRIAQELLPGGTVAVLQTNLADDAAALEKRLQRVARDVLSGLAALHGKAHVLHRDIKPANVLLAADGTAKLADFGCCAVLSPDAPLEARSQQGSIAYMAPERLRGEAHGAASDLWSVGVTLLQLALGGAHPFLPAHTAADGASRFWALAERLKHTSTDVNERCAATRAAVAAAAARTRFSVAFSGFLAGCLASEPEKRMTVTEALRHRWLAAATP